MSVTKRIASGDYNLTTATGGNIVATTNTFKIFGNLYVQGNTTVVNVANISTADPTITLDSNVVTPYQGYSGIEVYRGATANATNYTTAIYWSETSKAWQIATNVANVSTYTNIATTASGSGTVNSGNITQLAYFASNGTAVSTTGANLTWDGTSILTVTGNVSTTGLKVGGTANITANTTIGGGGTGIYVNNNGNSGELATKAAAIKYSIIFG